MPETDTALPDAFQRVYHATLLYRQKPELTTLPISRHLKKLTGNVEVEQDAAGHIVATHLDHTVTYIDEKTVPAQFVIIETARTGEAMLDLSSLQQSWDWAEAEDVVPECQHQLKVTDLMASGLPIQERVQLFRSSLRALIQAYPPDAIHFPISHQYHSAETFMESFGEETDPLCGMANVRMFNISGTDSVLMDTVGLGAMGLCDLQCCFSQLDPNDIGNLLWNTAYYLYGNGDVIEDGHTIQGIEDGSDWKCEHRLALQGPDRPVVNILPAAPYAVSFYKD